MTPPATTSPDRLRAAFVRRIHGVRGEVRAEMLGGDVRRFRRGLRLQVESSDRQVVIRSARDGGEGTVLLGFQGVETPAEATLLRGVYLCVPTSTARRLGDGEWFTWQLVGLRAVTPEGADLGTVRDIEPAPAADILVVDTGSGARRFPMVREFVRSVDITGGTITLAPLPEDTA